MKKIYLIILTVFLSIASISCSPQGLADDNPEPQACCGEDDHIPPPPPNGGG